MAYATTNPPLLLVEGVGGFMRIWGYRSTDAATAVRVDGYITNASDLGLQAGDVLISIDTDASPIAGQIHMVSAINANGSADLSDGVAITATDTD